MGNDTYFLNAAIPELRFRDLCADITISPTMSGVLLDHGFLATRVIVVSLYSVVPREASQETEGTC